MERVNFVAAFVAAAVFAVGGYFVGMKVEGAKPAKPVGTPVAVKGKKQAKDDCQAATKTCKVTIFPNCTDPNAPAPETCDPYVEFDVVVIARDKGKKIEFSIDKKEKVVFGASGIEFADATINSKCTRDSDQEYSCEVPSGLAADAYKYAVRLRDAGSLDPWVVNL